MKKKIGREASVSGEAVPCATHAQETRTAATALQRIIKKIAQHAEGGQNGSASYAIDRLTLIQDLAHLALKNLARLAPAASRVRAESDAHGTADFEAQR